MQVAQTLTAVVVSIVAAVVDLRTGRIPNGVTFPAVVAGIAMSAMAGWHALLQRVAIVLIVLMAGALLFYFHVFGGGDGKLAAAIAAIAGGRLAAEAAVYAIALGGVIAAIILLRRRALIPALLRAVQTVAGNPLPAPPSGGTSIPFGPILGLGVIVASATSYYGWHLSEVFS
jgi:Flp pilus assembly protein protease CpaA